MATASFQNAWNIDTQRSSTPPVQDSVVPDSIQSRTHRSVRDLGPGYSGDGNIFVTLFNNMATAADEAPPWSYYPMYRDAFLRQFYKTEPTMVGAVYSMAARGKALAYNFEGGPNKKKYWNNLAKSCEMGKGIQQLAFLSIIDLLTQDNGFFWELVGAGDPDGPLVGPATDILHMDAARCWRTFNPMYPVIYHSPDDGTWHRMHHTRVVTDSNMPMPDELARGIGFCAVSRALSLARTMRAMQRYKYEKITGTQPGIVYGSGFNRASFEAATTTSKADAQAQGMIFWNGIPVILNPSTNAQVSLDILALKGLPDGFDWETDATLYIYSMALAFGVDAREFWPASSSGATKADASIQHMKAQGKGIADIISTLEGAWRQVLPDDVLFQYDFTDDEQDMQTAQIEQTRVAFYTSLVSSGIMNAKQAELHLIKDDVLDPVLMAQAENWVDPNTPQQFGPDGKPLPPKELPPPELQNPDRSISQQQRENPIGLDKLKVAAQAEDMGRVTNDGGSKKALSSGDDALRYGGTKATRAADRLAVLSATVRGQKGIGPRYLRLDQKDWDQTREKLVDNLTKVIQGGSDGDLTKTKAGAQMRAQLNKLGLQALNDGLASGGLEQESISTEQLNAWKAWKARTSKYVSSLMTTMYDENGAVLDARAKAELWANKSLREIYWEGVVLASPTTEYKWIVTAGKNHCDTCGGNEGKTKTMDEWADAGLPQSDDLDCKGFNCGCDLEPVSA